MKLASLEAIVRVLNDANVRYLVVGGLAVAAHGYGRVTFDVDLVVQLQPQNVRQAITQKIVTCNTNSYKKFNKNNEV